MTTLLTGASGFLGRYLVKELRDDSLLTLGRSASNSVVCDLATSVPTLPACSLVVHAAGMAHVTPRSGEQRSQFFRVNVTGTENLLAGLDARTLPSAIVLISSVAVYGRTSGRLIRESEPLSATDAYGVSKCGSERALASWCRERGVRCATLRLPLLAGYDPPGNLGAMIRAIRAGFYFNIAGGGASKSIALARDVAAIVRRAADRGGTYNLTDGESPTFAALARGIATQLGKEPPRNMPLGAAKVLAQLGDLARGRGPLTSAKLRTLTSELTFDDTLARAELGWDPEPVLRGLDVLHPDI